VAPRVFFLSLFGILYFTRQQCLFLFNQNKIREITNIGRLRQRQKKPVEEKKVE